MKFTSREQVEYIYSLFDFSGELTSCNCFKCPFGDETATCALNVFQFDYTYKCPDRFQSEKIFPEKTKLNNKLD